MRKASTLVRALKQTGTPERAKASAWYFKTGKGQYGYGDVFIGATVPQQRTLAKKYASLSLAEVEKLLTHKIHECRLTGLLILVGKYAKVEPSQKKEIAEFYLSHIDRVNNWDLVDLSAPYILGSFLFSKPTKRKILYTLAQSQNMWKRRVAILATFWFIRENDFADSLRIAELLLHDKQDLIHKAVGWMLREIGKRSVHTLELFLNKHASSMPRTMLRYAIEKFSEQKRRTYLKT